MVTTSMALALPRQTRIFSSGAHLTGDFSSSRHLGSKGPKEAELQREDRRRRPLHQVVLEYSPLDRHGFDMLTSCQEWPLGHPTAELAQGNLLLPGGFGEDPHRGEYTAEPHLSSYPGV